MTGSCAQQASLMCSAWDGQRLGELGNWFSPCSGAVGRKREECHWFWAVRLVAPCEHLLRLLTASSPNSPLCPTDTQCIFTQQASEVPTIFPLSAQSLPFINLLELWNNIAVLWNRRWGFLRWGKEFVICLGPGTLSGGEIRQDLLAIYLPSLPNSPSLSSIVCSSLDLVHLETRTKTAPSLSLTLLDLYLLISPLPGYRTIGGSFSAASLDLSSTLFLLASLGFFFPSFVACEYHRTNIQIPGVLRRNCPWRGHLGKRYWGTFSIPGWC